MTPSSASTAALTSTANPPKLFLLPTDTAHDARIVTLANPQSGTPCRYYFCPEKGLYEFTEIAAPKMSPRSWLLARDRTTSSDKGAALTRRVDGPKTTTPSMEKGLVTQNANLFVATPMDPLFLILPALKPGPCSTKADSTKQPFLSSDDYLDTLQSSSSHLTHVLKHEPARCKFEERMRAVCDTVEAGDEVMLRLNEQSLLKHLADRARAMVEHGLPASLEEDHVGRRLEVPVLGIKREESAVSTSTPETSTDEASTSQQQPISTEPSISSDSVASTATPLSSVTSDPDLSPKDMAQLLRLRTALSYLFARYLPSDLADSLNILLCASDSPFDFKPLDAHLDHLAALRREAFSSRSMGDFSRKRGMNEDDEAAEGRAEKKRRKEEEEKKKRAGESRGVRDLKKVDVSGMKKMSDFFGAKRKK